MTESQRFIDRYSSALPEPHCDHCGFALSGLADRGTCPECGTEFDPATTGIPRRFRLARAAGYLALPIGIAIASVALTALLDTSTSDGATFGILILLPAPLAIAWFGWRTGRAATLVFTRCNPRRRAQGGLSVGFLAMFLGLLGTGLLLSLGFAVARGIDA